MRNTKFISCNITELSEFRRYILEQSLTDLFNSATITFQENGKTYEMWLGSDGNLIEVKIMEVDYE